MNRLTCCVASMVTVLACGCAAAPEETAEGGRAAETVTEPSAVAATTAGATNPAGGAALAPLIVDAKELAAVSPPLQCREMLIKGSNVIRKTCGTKAQWEKYDRAEAAEAAALTRTLQGGRYR
jgi:hypothetical protein